MAMRRNYFTILFFIKKSKLLKNGEAPICMRITVLASMFTISIITVISGLTSVSFSLRIRIPCRNLVNPGGTSWISRQDDYL